MSRTYRNRNTVPKGWTVRDDGYPYYHGHDKYGENTLRYQVAGYSRWKNAPRYRKSRYRCEKASFRRVYNRQYRNQVKHLIRNHRYEDILPPRRTSGWLSW